MAGPLSILAVVGGLWLSALAAPAGAAPADPADTGPAVAVRVDQVGYPIDGAKTAYVMVTHAVPEVRFSVRGARGTVLRGTSEQDLGAWNDRYRAIYRLTFSGLRRAGRYKIEVSAPGHATSPVFQIAAAPVLYRDLISHGVRYFTSERDGADVARSVLARRPANLTDRRAFVYAAPHYDVDDTLTDTTLHRIGGPVDVAGGWFDAGGGYEKFGYTGAYSDALLSTAVRYDPHDAALRAEAAFGLRWLEKLWDPRTRTAYLQVGIGVGGPAIAGDYDYWLLPQQEDRLGAQPGDSDYYVEYRPVFEAARPGQLISPGLAGRYAAAFALGAQLIAAGHPAQARRLLYLARTVYAQADTTHVDTVLTVYPHDFYPATQWRSDMVWGATEMSLADLALHRRGAAARDVQRAAHWARAYLAQAGDGRDTLNLYDDGAVAEADLIRAERALGGRPALPPSTLLEDLAAQVRTGEQRSAADPFALGAPVGADDATPHAFGLFTTAALYREYGGDDRFAGFAQHQLDYTLGANPWGTSFVVGAGSTFPHCLQSEIANLSGSLDGRGPIQLGAVGDGPSAPANFDGLGTVDGMRACHAGDFTPFDNASAAYEDDVVSWPSVEPAIDYTVNSVLAFVLAKRDPLTPNRTSHLR